MGAQAKLEQQALGMRCAHCLAYVAKMHVLPSLAPIPRAPCSGSPVVITDLLECIVPGTRRRQNSVLVERQELGW